MQILVVLAVLSIAACTEWFGIKKDKAAMSKSEKAMATSLDTSVNPLFRLASLEYTSLSERVLQHMAHFDFDEWGAMLADSVV